MLTIEIEEAKACLSELVERAASGESFLIAVAGKPVVKVTALEASHPNATKRLGFLAGQAEIPDDFNTMAQDDIISLFEGEE
ncbi:MAG: type II toxin-antitoxin system prevent-host-death family antitoxin [Massilia sp.]